MSQKLMHAGVGLDVDEAFALLHGTGLPGAAGGTPDLVNPGSFYIQDDDSGAIWTKTTVGTGSDKWKRMPAAAAPTTLSNVTTLVTLDYAPVDDANIIKWIVEATEVAVPANRWTAEIVAVHDGTPTADATEVDWNEYGTLRLGSPIQGLGFSCSLAGIGASQQLELQVESTDAVDVIARRVAIGSETTATVAMDATSVPHDLATTVFGTLANSEMIMFFAPTRAFQIPANFTNSRAISKTAATASAIFTVTVLANGTWTPSVIGTFEFGAGAKEAVFGAAVATTVNAGDVIMVEAPATADATLADISIGIQANYL